MDPEPSWLCSCGRVFAQAAALNYHKRSCRPVKKRLHGALVKAKEIWETRKKIRQDGQTQQAKEHDEFQRTSESMSETQPTIRMDSETEVCSLFSALEL
jgi:hypothetical protein